MKLQIQDDSLRLRIDEAELATLLGGGALRLCPRLRGQPLLHLELALGDALAFETGDSWRITLPAAATRAYAGTLPSREALRLHPGGDGPPVLLFEVDVRDSLQVRGPRRRA